MIGVKISINQLTQEQFDQYLERIVECAFREGALWQQCGGKEFMNIDNAIKNTKMNIIYDGCL